MNHSKPHTPVMHHYRRFIGILLIFISLGSILHAYGYGAKRGYDTKITFGFEHDAISAAVAISRLAYGFHEGYYGYRAVVNEMGKTLAPEGVHHSSPDLLTDRDKINQAFDQAIHLDPKTLPAYKGPDGQFVSLYAEDVGFADFYTLAFALFGFKADAMYKLYFLTFILSSLLFIVAYHEKTLPLAGLALICISFHAFFLSAVFNTSGMPSVNGNRFASTLGYIPILHLFSVMVSPPPWSRRTVLLLAAQAIIFSFAISIRMTTQWQLMVCVLLAAAIAAHAFRKAAPVSFRERLLQALRPSYVVAALIFTGTYMAYGVVQRTQLNPIYFSPCAQPYHMTWHSVMLGLANHPQFLNYAHEFTDGTAGDSIAWAAYERYQKQRGRPFTCPETGGQYRVREHEQVMRLLFFQFAERHPQFIRELFGYYKPQNIYHSLKVMLNAVFPEFWKVLIAASIMAGAVAATLVPGRRSMPWKMLALMFIGLLFSALPHLVAYPNFIMVDLFWMSIMNASLWIAAVTYRLFPAGLIMKHCCPGVRNENGID